MVRPHSDSAIRLELSTGLPTWIIERAAALGRDRASQDICEPPATARSFMTINEAATTLQVSSRSLRRMIAGGRIASVRVGRLVRIPRAAVEGLGAVR